MGLGSGGSVHAFCLEFLSTMVAELEGVTRSRSPPLTTARCPRFAPAESLTRSRSLAATTAAYCNPPARHHRHRPRLPRTNWGSNALPPAPTHYPGTPTHLHLGLQRTTWSSNALPGAPTHYLGDARVSHRLRRSRTAAAVAHFHIAADPVTTQTREYDRAGVVMSE